MKIYLASSWRNSYQPDMVAFLRNSGHDVYDFRNPPGRAGFGWEQINEHWTEWSLDEYRESLGHPLSVAGFKSDMDALANSDIVILLLPSGRSAHVEAGWASGAGKPVIVHIPEPCEPELMYKMFSTITTTYEELAETLLTYRC